jgi:hypothetical protein
MNKEHLILKHLNAPYKVGERVYIQVLGSKYANAWNTSTEILELSEEGVFIEEYNLKAFYPFSKVKKYISDIGYAPMEQLPMPPRSIAFSLDSILNALGLDYSYKKSVYKSNMGIEILNHSFNPFIFDKDGNKVYYQRPLCWTLEDKQLLIDSIYNGVSIGTIIVRRRSFEQIEQFHAQGHTDVAFREVVDGKQRISTIAEFTNNEFPDSKGFFWKDFAPNAQYKFFRDAGVFYAEYDEDTSDKIIQQGFLMVNFAGRPQSKEHIEFVKSIKM